MSVKITLAVVGIIIVLVLSVIAAYYLLKVRQLERRQQHQILEQKAEHDAQRLRVNRSIQIIAQGIINEELSLTEGAIRIKMLLESLSIPQEVRETYAAFYHLADATAHIPILEAWKALSTRKKMEFDRQRQQLESDHREFVQDAAQRILGQQF